MTSPRLQGEFAEDIVVLRLVGKVNKDIVGFISRHGFTAVGISGGMIPEVAAVRRALEGRVVSAHIIDDRVEHAVLLEILIDAGGGTKVTV